MLIAIIDEGFEDPPLEILMKKFNGGPIYLHELTEAENLGYDPGDFYLASDEPITTAIVQAYVKENACNFVFDEEDY